jgi:hypothetical protein
MHRRAESRQALAKWESGLSFSDFKWIVMMVATLNISLADVFGDRYVAMPQTEYGAQILSEIKELQKKLELRRALLPFGHGSRAALRKKRRGA